LGLGRAEVGGRFGGVRRTPWRLDSGHGDFLVNGRRHSCAGEHVSPSRRVAAPKLALAHRLQRPEGCRIGPRGADEVDTDDDEGDPQSHEDTDEQADGDHRRRQHGGDGEDRSGHTTIFAGSGPDTTGTRPFPGD
jgi:hypothetical protein